MFHLFTVMNIDNPSLMDYLYGLFIFVHIFSFTIILDQKEYSIIIDFLKMLFGFLLLYLQGYTWFKLSGVFVGCIIFYFILSFLITINFYFKQRSAI